MVWAEEVEGVVEEVVVVAKEVKEVKEVVVKPGATEEEVEVTEETVAEVVEAPRSTVES